MSWLAHLEFLIRELAHHVPLEYFVVIGSFVEELIGPIPSTLVMTTAGALAERSDHTLLFVVWLVVLGATGKTAAAWLYYLLGDKVEDVTLRKYGKYLGISHEDVESIGKRFGRHHWKDGGLLLLLRFIPFFPSTIISIGCGVIRIDPRVYLGATWVGSLVKDLLYAITGFVGIVAVHEIWKTAERTRWQLDVFVAIVVGLLLLYAFSHRTKAKLVLQKMVERYRQ